MVCTRTKIVNQLTVEKKMGMILHQDKHRNLSLEKLTYVNFFPDLMLFLINCTFKTMRDGGLFST